MSMPERIEVSSMLLRRQMPGDAPLIADAVAANREYLARWMPWATPEAATVPFQAERLAREPAEWAEGETYQFVLADAASGRMLGMVGLHGRIGPGGLELGYWLCEDATGRGRATAAAQALTSAGLALPGIERIEIHCDQANERSQRVPQRLGYRLDRIEPDLIATPAETGRSMVWILP